MHFDNQLQFLSVLRYFLERASFIFIPAHKFLKNVVLQDVRNAYHLGDSGTSVIGRDYCFCKNVVGKVVGTAYVRGNE